MRNTILKPLLKNGIKRLLPGKKIHTKSMILGKEQKYHGLSVLTLKKSQIKVELNGSMSMSDWARKVDLRLNRPNVLQMITRKGIHLAKGLQLNKHIRKLLGALICSERIGSSLKRNLGMMFQTKSSRRMNKYMVNSLRNLKTESMQEKSPTRY